MLYLISQVLLLLALASVISGLIGWLLRAFQSDKREQSLHRKLRSTQRSVPSMQRALAAAHYEIDRRENDIHRLNRKIAEIDSDPSFFRQGDFDNLDGMTQEERANAHVLQRVLSGNSQFRDSDFANGQPLSDADQQQAAEFLNTRSEDTEGRYRVEDFADGHPVGAAENLTADLIDQQRVTPEKFFREGDFVHGVPRNTEEQHFANHILHLRDENKSQREEAKEQRRQLVIELDNANEGLERAQRDAAALQAQIDQNSVTQANVTALETALANSHDVIKQQERQIVDLTSEIGAIDNDPQNFRDGEHLTEEEKAALHEQRATSGNSNFRLADFAAGGPHTEEEKRRAIEFLNNRDEDTDGKYRDGDFVNGKPMTEAEKELSTAIDSMREELEKHYRESDFEGDKPATEDEIKLEAHIEVMRAKNKTKRKAAKQRRQKLAEQLKQSEETLGEAQADIVRLQKQIDASPKVRTVNNLESALTEANDVIDRREQRIGELETKIEEIDTDPNHFRIGDLEHLNGLTPLERAMEISIARATSGNARYRDADFNGQIPLTDEERKLAIEFLATRDEDTDGKYRKADFVNGVPRNAEEFKRAASFDGMRTVLEKLYRDHDFEGDKPESAEELKLAARIDNMRAKNKAYRSAAKKQRKILKQDLANAKEEQQKAKIAVVELESRMQGIANTNQSLEDIIATLREDVGNKTALQDQAGKKASELVLTVDKLERDLARATHDGHKKAGDLERELRAAKEALAAAQLQAQSAEHSLQAAKTTLAERTADKDRLQEQYAHQKTELALANNQLSERKQEIVKLNAEKNRQIQDLQHELKDQQATTNRLEIELESLRREVANATSGNDSEIELRVAFEAQQAAANARVKELEAALQAQASEKTQTWEELKGQLESATQSLHSKDKDLNDANNQLNNLQSNLAEYEEIDDALRNRIEVLEELLSQQRMLAGKSMNSRIREIEAMLSAERRKVESLTIESNISDVTAHKTPVTRIVKTSTVTKRSK